MVAKGVDYFLYSGADEIVTEVTAPKIGNTYGPAANFRRNNLQISSSNIRGIGSYTGTLAFVTRRSGREVERRHQDINSWDGQLKRGTMHNMFNTPPRIGEEATVCWALYDAGSGKGVSAGLTNQHQLYVYATRNHRRWMSELAARDPRVARGAFARFALPGAHDAGMFDMRATMKLLNTPALYAALAGSFALIPVWGVFVAAAGGLARGFAPRAIANLSMT